MRQKSHNKIQSTYWDKIALKRERELSQQKTSWPAIKEMEEFFEFLNPQKNDRILEIGCGTGRYTMPLLQLGCKVHGTEISALSLRMLRKLAKAEHLERNLSLEATDFENPKKCQVHFNKYSKALMVAVIHHFDPPKRNTIMKNIVSSLKKGGSLTSLEPNPLNPFYYFLYFWRFLLNKQGVNRWSTETGMLYTNIFNLKRLYRRMGLVDIQVKRYAFFPSAFGKYFPPILLINDIITRTPILKEFSAYIWIKG